MRPILLFLTILLFEKNAVAVVCSNVQLDAQAVENQRTTKTIHPQIHKKPWHFSGYREDNAAMISLWLGIATVPLALLSILFFGVAIVWIPLYICLLGSPIFGLYALIKHTDRRRAAGWGALVSLLTLIGFTSLLLWLSGID